MNSLEIKQAFLEYYKVNDHLYLPSFPLLTNDSELLFTNSGMVGFKDFFTRHRKPPSTRIVTCQNCMRVGGKHNDLDEVGYSLRHHTFFNMLGSFSFYDYEQQDAIKYAYDFLIQVLKIDKDRLQYTFHPADTKTRNALKAITGKEPIPLDDNIWSAGKYGLYGYCTEVFYDIKPAIKSKDVNNDDKFIEIWNLVFMCGEKHSDGTIANFNSICVDTGMGLERISRVLQDVSSNYETDIFGNAMKYLQAIGIKDKANMRIIADHSRCIWHILSEGAIPSNEGAGYVIRKVMRRAIRTVQASDIELNFVDIMRNIRDTMYIDHDYVDILPIVEEELRMFDRSIEVGTRSMNAVIKKLKNNEIIPDHEVFKLYDTHGLAMDTIVCIANKHNLRVDEKGIDKLLELQREKSRSVTVNNIVDIEQLTGIAKTEFIYNSKACTATILKQFKQGDFICVVLDRTVFYGESGGQCGDTGYIKSSSKIIQVFDVKIVNGIFCHICSDFLNVTSKASLFIDYQRRELISQHHTSVHILQAALIKVLGDHVYQRGSFVGADGARFDFSHSRPLTHDQIHQVEKIANDIIRMDIDVNVGNTTYENAISKGATTIKGEKYSDNVRTIKIAYSDFDSYELCCGTHVNKTGDIKAFKITNVKSVSQGVRRVELIASYPAIDRLYDAYNRYTKVASCMNASYDNVYESVERMLTNNKSLNRDKIELLRKALEGSNSKMVQGYYVIEIDSSKSHADDFIPIVRKKAQGGSFALNIIDGKNVYIIASARSNTISATEFLSAYSNVNGNKNFARVTVPIDQYNAIG